MTKKQLASLIVSALILLVSLSLSAARPINIGSSHANVLEVMGSPTNIQHYSDKEVWFYKLSSITFTKGYVSAWSNLGNLQVYMGDKKPYSKPIKKGVPKKYVIAAMGTPTSIIKSDRSEVWFYELSLVTFNKGLVSYWEDKGNLKVLGKNFYPDEPFSKPDKNISRLAVHGREYIKSKNSGLIHLPQRLKRGICNKKRRVNHQSVNTASFSTPYYNPYSQPIQDI